ncbi:pyrimidine dimer DNA glycosylase/endonuclease V [Brachybacterium fresconis]|uniref:Pyrimidine dimer DNA glycosylase n=2 Tax=Brachybacterium fresconis TaxID=173363 RepID=A0ABS4YHA2_9MICO|nr:hypothetical protein [Brachybacterium fresconis]
MHRAGHGAGRSPLARIHEVQEDGQMRLWSLHPRHLERQGLTGCWRESLLAQAVLAGRTRGYRSHPQLERFRAQVDPLAALGAYLDVLAEEATARGYRFDRTRIDEAPNGGARPARIPVPDGQLACEWEHLLAKLEQRDPVRWQRVRRLAAPEPHPLFTVVPGAVASWERASPGGRPRSPGPAAPEIGPA